MWWQGEGPEGNKWLPAWELEDCEALDVWLAQTQGLTNQDQVEDNTTTHGQGQDDNTARHITSPTQQMQGQEDKTQGQDTQGQEDKSWRSLPRIIIPPRPQYGWH